MSEKSVQFPTGHESFAGWGMTASGLRKVTADRESNASAQLAVADYAKGLGLGARDLPFYILKETVSYEPIAKISFSVSQNVEPIES